MAVGIRARRPGRYLYRWKRNPDLVSPEARERARVELAHLMEGAMRRYGAVIDTSRATAAVKDDPEAASKVMKALFEMRQLVLREPTQVLDGHMTLFGFLKAAQYVETDARSAG